MSNIILRGLHLQYQLFEGLIDDSDLPVNIIKIFTNQDRPRVVSSDLNLFKHNYTDFKDSREVLLSQAGALKDDDMLDELLEFIYRERGRSMTE